MSLETVAPSHSASLIIWQPPIAWGLYLRNWYRSRRPRLPQEVWNMIIGYLPSLDGRLAAQMFGFQLTRPHDVHSSIWSKIWRENSTWPSFAESLGLNVALVGDDLHDLGKDRNTTAYLVLVTGDPFFGEIRFRKDELFASLQPHQRNGDTIIFQHSKIVLNIEDALRCPEMVTLATEKLFSCPNGGLQTACLYWEDAEYLIHTIGFESIVGLGERNSTMEYTKWICDITLPHLEERFLESKQRQTFSQLDCPKVRPVWRRDPQGRRTRKVLLGWELENE